MRHYSASQLLDYGVFGSLSDRKFHWREFSSSLGLHAVLVLLLVCIPLSVTSQPEFYQIVFIRPRPFVAPLAPSMPAQLQAPAARKITVALKIMELPRPSKEPVPEQEKLPAKANETALSRPLLVPDLPDSVMPPLLVSSLPESQPSLPRAVEPSVRTNVFSRVEAKTSDARALRLVQTGGLGTHYELPYQPKDRAAVTQLGSFDLRAGQGDGNGWNGRSGARGPVASAGFENGIAGERAGRNPGGGGVELSGFGDLNQVPDPPDAGDNQPTGHSDEAAWQPVEIISKPRPIYPEEARELKLEGEVLLEVTFAATGEVRVLRLIRGLGHGLDEAAIRAAEQIRFKTALRNGQPVDSRATVYIVFRLA